MIKFEGYIEDNNGEVLIKKVAGYYKIFENLSKLKEWSGTFEILAKDRKLKPGPVYICTSDGKKGKIDVLNLHTKSDGIKWVSFLGYGAIPQ